MKKLSRRDIILLPFIIFDIWNLTEIPTSWWEYYLFLANPYVGEIRGNSQNLDFVKIMNGFFEFTKQKCQKEGIYAH